MKPFLHSFAALTRLHDWWPYKLPVLAGTAYASAWIAGMPLTMLLETLLTLLLTLAISASYVSIINDACDREDDRKCGKFNFLNQRSRLFTASALALTLLLGIALTVFLIQGLISVMLYWATWLVFTAYSAPPLRLKKRGLLGCLADAVGANTLPHLYVTVSIFAAAGKPVPPEWLACITLWSTAMGLRGIFWHQLADLGNDLKSGVGTLATRHAPQSLSRIGRNLVFPLEVIGFSGMLILAHSFMPWVWLVFYLAALGLYRHFWNTPISVITPHPNQRVVMMEYYDLFYPLAYLVAASIAQINDVLVLLLHFVLFRQRLTWWIKDLNGLFRWEIWPRRPFKKTR